MPIRYSPAQFAAGLLTALITLGMSPAQELEWATRPAVAFLLLLALLLGWLFENAATIACYWRDRP